MRHARRACQHTLSVSIDASVSPAFSSSPTFFAHAETVPTVIVGESAGIGSVVCSGNVEKQDATLDVCKNNPKREKSLHNEYVGRRLKELTCSRRTLVRGMMARVPTWILQGCACKSSTYAGRQALPCMRRQRTRTAEA